MVCIVLVEMFYTKFINIETEFCLALVMCLLSCCKGNGVMTILVHVLNQLVVCYNGACLGPYILCIILM